MGLIIGGVTTAAILQAIVFFDLIARIDQNHQELCHIAVAQHVVVAGCREPK